MIKTVKELKEILNNFDDNAEIYIDDDYNCMVSKIDKLEIDKEGDVVIKLK